MVPENANFQSEDNQKKTNNIWRRFESSIWKNIFIRRIFGCKIFFAFSKQNLIFLRSFSKVFFLLFLRFSLKLCQYLWRRVHRSVNDLSVDFFVPEINNIKKRLQRRQLRSGCGSSTPIERTVKRRPFLLDSDKGCKTSLSKQVQAIIPKNELYWGTTDMSGALD